MTYLKVIKQNIQGGGERFAPHRLIRVKRICYEDIWKISNITPVRKKSEKQLVRNYQPISLLPILIKCLKNYTLVGYTTFFLLGDY